MDATETETATELLLEVCDRALRHIDKLHHGADSWSVEDEMMRVFLAGAGESHDVDVILGYVLIDPSLRECTLSVECDGVMPANAFDFGVVLRLNEFVPACRTEDHARYPSVLPMLMMPYWTGIKLTCQSDVDPDSMRIFCIKVLDEETRRKMVEATKDLPHSLGLLPDISELIERRVLEPEARKRAKARHDCIVEELMVYCWDPLRLAALSGNDPERFWALLEN